ncbi:MAG: hypothetical protein OXO50_14580, partial [Caldilineaceae bacterium]|nr:hypothetical protein [Caldilineaceae bacterium]
PLWGGAPPPQRPLSYNLAPQRLCGQYEVVVPRRPTIPPASWQIPNLCQRRQGRRGDSQLGLAYTAMTFKSPLQKS